MSEQHTEAMRQATRTKLDAIKRDALRTITQDIEDNE